MQVGPRGQAFKRRVRAESYLDSRKKDERSLGETCPEKGSVEKRGEIDHNWNNTTWYEVNGHQS